MQPVTTKKAAVQIRNRLIKKGHTNVRIKWGKNSRYIVTQGRKPRIKKK